MANSRSFSVATAANNAPTPLHPQPARLRAVEQTDTDREASTAQVVDFLPPGATWLPAPPHTLPTVPGQPPMIGYLVLVPADLDPRGAVRVAAASEHPAAAGPVQIDSAERTALVNGRQLDLTYLEFELLAHLVAHPHRVHTRDQLVPTVWGYGHVGDGRTVDVHVARLRRKLGAEHRRTIQTVRRVGYKYAP
jgi:hypothetical protein